MPKRFRACFSWLKKAEMTAGKITLFAVLTGAILSGTTLAAYFELSVPFAVASTVNTSVTVLNTPPVWTQNAHEEVESSTSTPTNIGAVLAFRGLGTDSNNDNYFLIICKNNVIPTPHSLAPPTCSGGVSNLWAISGTTTSGVEARASTTTREVAYWATESNDWYGWVCDAVSVGPQCNTQMENGDEANFPNKSSPFVINHPPAFMTVANTSPKDPGAVISWTTTATDTDVLRGGDTLFLYVCKAADFATSTGCGAGGTWATSTAYRINPAASSTIVIPSQDKAYNAFVYIEDQSFEAATSTNQGAASPYTVNNVAPTIDATQISLINHGGGAGDLTLTSPQASTTGFKITFVVTDNNGCQNASLGNEIASATTSIYRSSVTSAQCQLSSQYNTNSCYPSANPLTLISCSQDTAVNSCTGATDSTVGWSCNFQLWYNADPTDAGSFYTADNWLGQVQATDDNGALSSSTVSTTGNEVDQFLAFNVSTTSIAYGGLQPGQSNSPIVQTTDLQEIGNTGLDESLYGDTMCTTHTTADSCDVGGANPATKIPVSNQKFASSSVTYTDPLTNALTSSTSPSSFALHVLKTTATSTPQTKNTYWGIAVPIAITLAGDYSGVDTITAVTSNSSFW